MGKRRQPDIKYEYLITGPEGTRGGQLFAQNHVEARSQVTAMLKAGESIYSLNIDRR
jgi:hypothetical protein